MSASDVIETQVNANSQGREKAAKALSLFASVASKPGSVLLEQTLLAYNRGQHSFTASDPLDKWEIGADQSIPDNWGEQFNCFVSDRSYFYFVLFSYEFGQELLLGESEFSGSNRGPEAAPRIPKALVWKFARATRFKANANFSATSDNLPTEAISNPARLLVKPNRKDYLEDVRRLQEHIRQGDIYQANLTGQWLVRSDADPWEVYLRLRQLNPSQYGGFVSLGDITLISSSPERLFRTEAGRISALPIKGTIARGQSESETQSNKNRLLASEKDRAELLMIVDLLRNDLGRICRYGSVHTESIWSPEIYSSLIHLVGSISGQLNDEVTPADIVSAIFPGGSITGAPKRRAVEILKRIENRPRGVYTGSFGYLQGDVFDMNIGIRTITCSDGVYSVQAGGGIVADSDPQAEYEEACLKARNLLKAIDPALDP